MNHYLFDEYNVRYNLIGSRPGRNLNWIFIPSGPGADSRYLRGLVEILNVPGNFWLMDLPGNGDHTTESNPNFDQWLDIFCPSISKFENIVLVGHSIGGQLTFLFPQLEEKVLGFVAMNSAPKNWMEEMMKLAQEKNLPDLTPSMMALLENEGYRVFSADNGKDGLDILKTMPKPCLILLDFMMPIMNGQEFMDAKAQDDAVATIPVVIVSAYEDRARMIKASGFVKKPFDFDSLLRFVNQYCTTESQLPDRGLHEAKNG